MRKRRAWFAVGSAILVLAAACARSSTPSAAAAPADRIEPPRMLTRGTFPEIDVPGPNAADRPTVNLRLEVLIDASGRPDMKTLKIVGLVAPTSRMAIERWLEDATYRPASQNGQPVPGVFKLSLSARVVIRRG